MKKERAQLLELVRSSLWGGVPSNAPFESGVDWNSLLQQAKQQSLLGVAYSQLEHLADRPNLKLMMQLHKLTTLNRTMQLKQLQVVDSVTKRLQEIGIQRPVLLKGLGVTYNYLDPGVRQCGDIDLYVGKEHYEKACCAAKTWAESDTSNSLMTDKHFDFLFDGIPVEIHRIVISNNNISRNRSKFSEWCVACLEGDQLREELIDGVKVYLPPYNFDAIYIFFHAWSHFCNYGISFRQVCDWCRYLAKHKDNIDRDRLSDDLSRFGLIRPWSFFASVAVNDLGLDSALVPDFDSSQDWHTQLVAERIWVGGNFGFYGGQMAAGGTNVIARKFINFVALLNSYSYLRKLDRKYSTNFILHTPFNSIRTNISYLVYKITKG